MLCTVCHLISMHVPHQSPLCQFTQWVSVSISGNWLRVNILKHFLKHQLSSIDLAWCVDEPHSDWWRQCSVRNNCNWSCCPEDRVASSGVYISIDWLAIDSCFQRGCFSQANGCALLCSWRLCSLKPGWNILKHDLTWLFTDRKSVV